jgi:hypothetical protein
MEQVLGIVYRNAIYFVAINNEKERKQLEFAQRTQG